MLKVIVILLSAGMGSLGGLWAGRYIPDKTWRLRLTMLAAVAIGAVGAVAYDAALPQVEPPEALSIPFVDHTISADFDDARSVHTADLDGDGDADVLAAAGEPASIVWWENGGIGNFGAHIITEDFSGARAVYAADLDGDGDVDVLGAAYDGRQIAWWENDGAGSLTRRTTVDLLEGAVDVHAADLDRDGDVDILAALQGSIIWLENVGSGSMEGRVVADGLDGLVSVHAADLNGDGAVDVVGARLADIVSGGEDVLWWENQGAGRFTAHVIAEEFDGAESVHAADVDDDADVDILGALATDSVLGRGEIAWWENDGSGSFTYHTIAGEFDGAACVYAADLDGDGDTDIVGASRTGAVAWWQNGGAGGFTHYAIADQPRGAFAVHAADLDGDGDLDVLGAAPETGRITWWENVR